MRGQALLIALLLAPAVVRAACTDGERADLQQMGMTEKEIVALCDIRPEAGRPAGDGPAFYCATADGYCPLPGAEPAGRSCSCDTAYGPVAGTTE